MRASTTRACILSARTPNVWSFEEKTSPRGSRGLIARLVRRFRVRCQRAFSPMLNSPDSRIVLVGNEQVALTIYGNARRESKARGGRLPPSPEKSMLPFTATVVIASLTASTLRTRELPNSAMKRLFWLSKATAFRNVRLAGTAVPPSPENPELPSPATVDMSPTEGLAKTVSPATPTTKAPNTRLQTTSRAQIGARLSRCIET